MVYARGGGICTSLVHVSLFLFFLGLGDLLLNINTTVGITTVVPITICAFLSERQTASSANC
ncbi:hypothetical protein EDB92DRAFT_1860623 [Lactarius akahatsu]|uniref:Uncharacterized protein n=1 Tax=Lactarius akahatsu TaxID=416441 RepID=A0AAD4LFB8_9AGAM|nr:hypothetical protein EDB92DRAFT_1860623 [Lactarius akahatsu]